MPKDKPVQETFTRLNISMCDHDVGVRPLVCDCSGYRCSSMEVLPGLELTARQESTINVTIKNYGNMDATAVLMESAYTIFIGNERESFVPISSQTIPIIPAGMHEIAVMHWTPPDTQSTHACLHARVFDTYSMLHASENGIDLTNWSSRHNPQAGWVNVRLIPITNRNRPLVVNYFAKNFSKTSNIKTNTLVTVVNNRTRIRNIDEEYPLPFRFETRIKKHFDSTFHHRMLSRTNLRLATGRRLPSIDVNSLWPRSEINPHFIHERFGVANPTDLDFPRTFRSQKIGNIFTSQDISGIKIKSLNAKKLKPLEEMKIPVVIPPSEFPQRGRRKIFRVNYQKGNEEPIVHFIYLYH